MRISIAIIFALCVASTLQQNSGCVNALEGLVGSAVNIANDIKGKKATDAISQISQFVNQVEGVLGGACKGLSISQVKQVIDNEVHGGAKGCLDAILDAVDDAKKLVHDVKHHKIIKIIKYAVKTAKAFGKIRGSCSKHAELY